jgi:hypothetical protein
VLDAVLGEPEISMLKGLLDLREVMERNVDPMGQGADLLGSETVDFDLVRPGALHRHRLRHEGTGEVGRVRGPDRTR